MPIKKRWLAAGLAALTANQALRSQESGPERELDVRKNVSETRTGTVSQVRAVLRSADGEVDAAKEALAQVQVEGPAQQGDTIGGSPDPDGGLDSDTVQDTDSDADTDSESELDSETDANLSYYWNKGFNLAKATGIFGLLGLAGLHALAKFRDKKTGKTQMTTASLEMEGVDATDLEDIPADSFRYHQRLYASIRPFLHGIRHQVKNWIQTAERTTTGQEMLHGLSPFLVKPLNAKDETDERLTLRMPASIANSLEKTKDYEVMRLPSVFGLSKRMINRLTGSQERHTKAISKNGDGFKTTVPAIGAVMSYGNKEQCIVSSFERELFDAVRDELERFGNQPNVFWSAYRRGGTRFIYDPSTEQELKKMVELIRVLRAEESEDKPWSTPLVINFTKTKVVKPEAKRREEQVGRIVECLPWDTICYGIAHSDRVAYAERLYDSGVDTNALIRLCSDTDTQKVYDLRPELTDLPTIGASVPMRELIALLGLDTVHLRVDRRTMKDVYRVCEDIIDNNEHCFGSFLHCSPQELKKQLRTLPEPARYRLQSLGLAALKDKQYNGNAPRRSKSLTPRKRLAQYIGEIDSSAKATADIASSRSKLSEQYQSIVDAFSPKPSDERLRQDSMTSITYGFLCKECIVQRGTEQARPHNSGIPLQPRTISEVEEALKGRDIPLSYINAAKAWNAEPDSPSRARIFKKELRKLFDCDVKHLSEISIHSLDAGDQFLYKGAVCTVIESKTRNEESITVPIGAKHPEIRSCITALGFPTIFTLAHPDGTTFKISSAELALSKIACDKHVSWWHDSRRLGAGLCIPRILPGTTLDVANLHADEDEELLEKTTLRIVDSYNNIRRALQRDPEANVLSEEFITERMKEALAFWHTQNPNRPEVAEDFDSLIPEHKIKARQVVMAAIRILPVRTLPNTCPAFRNDTILQEDLANHIAIAKQHGEDTLAMVLQRLQADGMLPVSRDVREKEAIEGDEHSSGYIWYRLPDGSSKKPAFINLESVLGNPLGEPVKARENEKIFGINVFDARKVTGECTTLCNEVMASLAA